MIEVNLGINMYLLGRIKKIRYQEKWILTFLYNIVEFSEVDT